MARYLEMLYPQHCFEVLHVGARIKALENNFTAAALEKAELILFFYPVYTFIAPNQLHRFIELMKASGVDTAGKYLTQMSTSKHFYDVTAHAYIQDNCHDLGLKYIRGLPADMDDLTAKRAVLCPACACIRMVLLKLKQKAGSKMTKGVLMPLQESA